MPDINKDLIVLFYPKVDRDNIKKHIPLPVLKLASELISAGYRIEVVDARFQKMYKSRLKKLMPRMFCFCVSAMTGYQIRDGLEASKFVKSRDPGIPVIWGGWHASLLPEETIKNKFIDIIVRGQGEFALKEALSALFNNKTLYNIPGVSFKDSEKIVHNPDRPFEDINKFADTNFEILDFSKYTYQSYIGQRTIFWNTSQGCPFRCAFCCTNKVYGRRWSGFSAERILNEIEILAKRFNIDAICFTEDNFFVDKTRVERICDGLIRKRLGIKWEVDGRVDQVAKFSDDFLSLLKKSGCEKIYVGAESADESVLKLIDKDINIDDTYKTVQLLDKHKIIAEVFLMFGFPENPKQDLEKTLTMIKEIKQTYPNHQSTPFLYTPYPGSRLYEMSVQKGLKVPQKLEDWIKWNVLEVITPWVNKSYLDEINRLIKFYYPFAYPSSSLKDMFKNKKWGIFYRLMHRIARFRVKHNFFLMPFEWHITKNFYYNLKLKYNLFRGLNAPR